MISPDARPTLCPADYDINIDVLPANRLTAWPTIQPLQAVDYTNPFRGDWQNDVIRQVPECRDGMTCTLWRQNASPDYPFQSLMIRFSDSLVKDEVTNVITKVASILAQNHEPRLEFHEGYLLDYFDFGKLFVVPDDFGEPNGIALPVGGGKSVVISYSEIITIFSGNDQEFRGIYLPNYQIPTSKQPLTIIEPNQMPGMAADGVTEIIEPQPQAGRAFEGFKNLLLNEVVSIAIVVGAIVVIIDFMGPKIISGIFYPVSKYWQARDTVDTAIDSGKEKVRQTVSDIESAINRTQTNARQRIGSKFKRRK